MYPCQLSQIIRESLGYRPNLLLSHTGHRISCTILVKAHNIYFSDIFWPIFGIVLGKMFDTFFRFNLFDRSLFEQLFLGQGQKKVKLAISQILIFLGWHLCIC